MRYVYAPGSDAAHSAGVLAQPPPAGVSRPTILRAAVAYDLATPDTPQGIRAVAAAAERGATLPPPGGWRHRATFALAENTDEGIVASLCLRLNGDLPGRVRRAWVAYARGEGGGWEPQGAALLDHGDTAQPLRQIGIEPLKAMLQGEVWVPPPPALVFSVPCPTCGRPAKLTGVGKIYANHKCENTQVEGRS